MQINADIEYDPRTDTHGRFRLVITEIVAKLGTRLDEKHIKQFNERAIIVGLNGTFEVAEDDTVLYFFPQERSDYPRNVEAIQEFLAYYFGKQPIQYEVTPAGDQYVRETDGQEWILYSAGNDLWYMSADDPIGFYMP